MDCPHFEAGRCRSCSWLTRGYAEQLAAKGDAAARTLGIPRGAWLPPCPSLEQGFRNKAKMVVTGTLEAPRLGLLGESGEGIDLRDCGLHTPALQAALPVLAEFVTRARVQPYDVARRVGELKLLLVTAAPDERLMVRFVTRSQEPVARIRKHLPWLHEQLPALHVVSVNLQPEPKAVLEGERELLLSTADSLTMHVNGLDLHLRPQSFFQTNTDVAAALYREAADWVRQSGVSTAWDLYCGVGGFALHIARAAGCDVLGVESSAEAVESARTTALESGILARFDVGDATTYAISALASQDRPDAVVVNPPRRGIGTDLAHLLESSTVPTVAYSSCNPESLARDLAAMPSYSVRRARLFDMFPHTAHAEVLVLLQRTGL